MYTVARIEPSKWDLWVKILTLGNVDLFAIKHLQFIKGYSKGREDERATWWKEQDAELEGKE
jgi:hypothetical protein